MVLDETCVAPGASETLLTAPVVGQHGKHDLTVAGFGDGARRGYALPDEACTLAAERLYSVMW
jgi:hypothetical protein